MTKLVLTVAPIFGAQGAMAWLFYRSRVVSHASWTDSDLVVFGLPLVAGAVVSFGVLFFRFPQISVSKRFGISGVGAVFSSFVGTTVAFNLYGT